MCVCVCVQHLSYAMTLWVGLVIAAQSFSHTKTVDSRTHRQTDRQILGRGNNIVAIMALYDNYSFSNKYITSAAVQCWSCFWLLSF